VTDDLVVRRVVTGADATGDAVVLGDGAITEVRTLPTVEGWAIATVWQDERPLQVPLRSLDDGHAAVADQRVLAAGGTRFLIWRLPPETAGENPAGMHETDTFDFIVVLSGSVSLVFGNGDDVDLAAGDCLVQGGNLHHWRNTTSQPCVMAVFMVGATRAG
jgi:mannose-6-phosphate isomerase-like protein (cupin superfamily)